MADSQVGSLCVISQPKPLLKKRLAALQESLLKIKSGHILPTLTCPPSQKVSQVEIEAGDSEGRLPYFFCELNLCFVLANLRAQ